MQGKKNTKQFLLLEVYIGNVFGDANKGTSLAREDAVVIFQYLLRTRCSPRTQMLTRMLMDMQSLRTIFCNSLFEQSCIYIFPCYQSEVWSEKCRVWSVECRVRSVECKVWSVECKV